jgi:hypothetical protein
MVQGATGIFGIGLEAAVMKEPLARKAAGETDLGPTSKCNLTASERVCVKQRCCLRETIINHHHRHSIRLARMPLGLRASSVGGSESERSRSRLSAAERDAAAGHALACGWLAGCDAHFLASARRQLVMALL